MGIFRGYPLSRSPSPHYAALCPRESCAFWDYASALFGHPCYSSYRLERSWSCVNSSCSSAKRSCNWLTLLPQFGVYHTDFLDSLYEQL